MYGMNFQTRNNGGDGTFDNPIRLGGTVRDQYGRDVLHTYGKLYGKNLNANQELDRLNKIGTNASRVEIPPVNTQMTLVPRNGTTAATTTPTDGYSVALAKSLIANWKRGNALTEANREIVRRYLMTQGLYSDNPDDTDALLASYVQKTEQKSGGNGQGWTTTVSNPVSVETKKNKVMTDSSKWYRR